MQPDVEKILEEIGSQLDRNIFPLVMNGGIVTPNVSTVPSEILGEEFENHDTQRQRGSTTRPWQRTTRRQRASSRSRSTSAPSSFICNDLQERYESQLDLVRSVYPETKIYRQPEGLWLLTKSNLLNGLNEKAIFLIGIPFSPSITVRSWGFWESIVGMSWIGARHTNFPDGSICAFEPKDNTWSSGEPLVNLIDLYTVWAVRHFYLKHFNLWPGAQSVHIVAERILELHSNECCGCGSIAKYADCCQKNDLSQNRISEVVSFFLHSPNYGKRNPPLPVEEFIRTQKQIPSLRELLF